LVIVTGNGFLSPEDSKEKLRIDGRDIPTAGLIITLADLTPD
jgi:hypothetical protein